MRSWAIVSGVSACLAATPALTQPVLEEVVVTAGFRERSLMDSAGSATIVSAQLIEQRQAQHLESVLAQPQT